jgi:hypothetical protein
MDNYSPVVKHHENKMSEMCMVYVMFDLSIISVSMEIFASKVSKVTKVLKKGKRVPQNKLAGSRITRK